MEIRVVKKSGESELFQKEKIVKACIGAGASPEVAQKIADDVAKTVRDQIPTSEIRTAILEKLRAENPALEATYLEHEKAKKKE